MCATKADQKPFKEFGKRKSCAVQQETGTHDGSGGDEISNEAISPVGGPMIDDNVGYEDVAITTLDATCIALPGAVEDGLLTFRITFG